MSWVTYEPYVPPCSGGPMPGTRALADALLRVYPIGYSLGIYNCRPPSIHGDGRAFDLGLPMVDGRANPIGRAIVAKVKAVAAELGVQEAIFDRTRWSQGHPDGAYYPGRPPQSPHEDHIHFSQSKNAATYLTFARALSLLGLPGGEDEGHTPIEDPDREELPMHYIRIVGEPADDNLYGYTDCEWWIADAEEVGSFGGARQVNARQRDVIRSRVLTNAKAREDASRQVARDEEHRANLAWIGGHANEAFPPAKIEEIKAIGARNGVLADLFVTGEPTREQPGSWSGGFQLPGWCQHCWVEHTMPCGLNSCQCPCPIPPERATEES